MVSPQAAVLYVIQWTFFSSCVALSVPSNEVRLRCSKNNIPKARMRTLKMSIVIVSSFVVCWTPYYLLGLWYWFLPEDLEGKVSHSLSHLLFIFGLVNACLDPIVYGLFTIQFRKGLQKYFGKAAKASELDDNTLATGSFTCAMASPKREVSSGGPQIPALCGENQRMASAGGERSFN